MRRLIPALALAALLHAQPAAAAEPHAPSVAHRVYPKATAASAMWHHGVSTFYSWQQYGCGKFQSWSISCRTRGHFACGGLYERATVAVAHLSLPCGTKVRLRNPANGREVTAVVRDRGPYTAGLDFDLTTAACLAIRHCYTGPLDWRVVK